MTELGRVTTLEGVIAVAKVRRKQLGLSQIALDDIAGLQVGYTGKLECGDKGLGKLSLPLVLGGLKLELVIMPATSQHRGESGRSEDFFSRRARKARAAQLERQTPRKRKNIARAAARARWKAERERKS